MITVHDRVGIDPKLVEAYRKILPATIGHFTLQGFADPAIKPMARGTFVVGPAFTVRAPGLDTGALDKAYELAQPGDIIVVDRCGDAKYACIGDGKAALCKVNGYEAMIVDGAATDLLETVEIGFPVFSRTISAVVGRYLGLEGEVNGVVNCGGVAVRPGDLVVADDNGVVILDPAHAWTLIQTCLQSQERVEKRKRDRLKTLGIELPGDASGVLRNQ